MFAVFRVGQFSTGGVGQFAPALTHAALRVIPIALVGRLRVFVVVVMLFSSILRSARSEGRSQERSTVVPSALKREGGPLYSSAGNEESEGAVRKRSRNPESEVD